MRLGPRFVALVAAGAVLTPLSVAPSQAAAPAASPVQSGVEWTAPIELGADHFANDLSI